MSENTVKILKAISTSMLVLCYVGLQIYGGENEKVGAVLFGCSMSAVCSLVYITASIPFSTDITEVLYVKISKICLILSFFTLPVLSLLTMSFPPKKFNSITTSIAITWLLVSGLGSGAPYLHKAVLIFTGERK